MLPRKQLQAFRAFYNASRDNDILDDRTTLLVHLAASLAVGCEP